VIHACICRSGTLAAAYRPAHSPMAPSCFGGGSQRDVADPLRSGSGRAWPAMTTTGGRHAARDELAEARAAAQTLRDQLRSANDKAALMLSYRDAAEREHRGMRDHTQRLQVSGRRSKLTQHCSAHCLPADFLRSAIQLISASAPRADVPHRSDGCMSLCMLCVRPC